LEGTAVRIYFSLALFALVAVATALLSTVALAGVVPAVVLIERALMAPDCP
jgi:hypothetical protein